MFFAMVKVIQTRPGIFVQKYIFMFVGAGLIWAGIKFMIMGCQIVSTYHMYLLYAHSNQLNQISVRLDEVLGPRARLES